MESYFHFLQESVFMHTFPIFRRFMSARGSSFIFFTAVLLVGLAAPLDLVAQQAEVDNSAPIVLAASSAAAPVVGEQPQASSVPAPSTSDRSAPAQTNPSSQSTTPQSATENQSQQQTKRILDVIPNFRAVNADEKLPPQSVKQKFVTATEDSFDYSSIFIPAVLAGYDMAIRATPEFHDGAAGYARYFWHSAVDQTSENYMVEFFVPALTREDTRYYTLGHGGFLKRTGYALSRSVITRSDSGKETFNVSETLGAGIASGLSNLYYPSATRSLSNTGTQWGEDIAIDAAAFVAKEFWPDINHRLFHHNEAAASEQKSSSGDK
jgi:hypothetical protein